MDPGQKRKKPPACDACKARRVLCHPSLAGCPRCIEKGLPCTTTPTVRKKRAGQAASPAPPAFTHAASTSSSTFPCTSTIPPSTTSLAYYQPFPPQEASISALPIPTPVLPLALLRNAPPPSAPLAGQPSQSFDGTQSVKMTPKLAEHLFFCFKQSTIYDHPAFAIVQLETLLSDLPSVWTPELLPTPQKVLVYCVLAAGARLSFSPAIIGTSGPLPQSFVELNEGVARGNVDLRDFGRRRAATCAMLFQRAERLAKEHDVAFDATPENAASAILLDSLIAMDATSESVRTIKQARPWLAAFHSHLRTIDDAGLSSGDPDRWAAYFAADQIMDLHSGRLTRTTTDDLTFTGEASPAPAVLDKRVKKDLQDTLNIELIMPHLRSLCRLYLDTGRKLVDEILGPFARRSELDHSALAEFMIVLGHIRSISQYIISTIDRISAKSPRNTRLVVFLWGSLVLPLYRELQRRFDSLEIDSDDFASRQAAERLTLSLSHCRDFLFAALQQTAESLMLQPSFSLFITMKRADLLKWAVVASDEIVAGRWVPDQRVASICERFSISLKLAGYVNSSPAIDDIINNLDAHVLAFQLSQQAQHLPTGFVVPQFQILSSPEESPPVGAPTVTQAEPVAAQSHSYSHSHSSSSRAENVPIAAYLDPTATGGDNLLSAQLSALEEELGIVREQRGGAPAEGMTGVEGFEQVGSTALGALEMSPGWDWAR